MDEEKIYVLCSDITKDLTMALLEKFDTEDCINIMALSGSLMIAESILAIDIDDDQKDELLESIFKKVIERVDRNKMTIKRMKVMGKMLKALTE